jgi:rod shape-determining protein MreC
LFIIGALTLIGLHVGREQGPAREALNAGDDAAAAAARAAGGPVRASGDFFEDVGRMWNSAARIEALEKENRDLMAWRAMAERLAERNARYEALLRMPPDAFGEGADIENSIAAQLVLDSGGPFTRTLVANAGADHGVHVGFIAVNERGLVGRVVSVGRRSARVLMLDDYNSRIPVMGEASRVRAVLAGQATQRPDLILRPFELQAPRLDFIVGAHSLREGERMVTSGDGGLYPRGINVGEARRGSDGVWRVALAATRGAVDFVRIIPYVGVETPEEAPVEEAGPPADARSNVVTIIREDPGARRAAGVSAAPRAQAETQPNTPAPAQIPAQAPAQIPAQPPVQAPGLTNGAETETPAPAAPQ